MKCQWDDCYIPAAGGEFFCLTHKEESKEIYRFANADPSTKTERLTPILVLNNGEPDSCFCAERRGHGAQHALPRHQCPYYADESPSDDNYCCCCALCTEECRLEKEEA